MVKHKYEFHKMISGFLKSNKRTCRTCNEICASNSEMITHKLTYHRTEFFIGKSGVKEGSKFLPSHRKNLSIALKKYYNTQESIRREERWCHDYEQWRLAVLKRDNRCCQVCNTKPPSKLVAHHIKPYRFFPLLRYEVTNGITLCETCHKQEEARLRKDRIQMKMFVRQLVLLSKNLCSNQKILIGNIGSIYFRKGIQ